MVSEYCPPKLKEYSVAQLWERIQQNERLLSYFPPCRGKPPSKKYLFKVLNTVAPEFVENLLEAINQVRERERPEEEEIVLTEGMIEFLEGKRGSKFGKKANSVKLLKRGRRWGRRRRNEPAQLNFEFNMDPRFR